MDSVNKFSNYVLVMIHCMYFKVNDGSQNIKICCHATCQGSMMAAAGPGHGQGALGAKPERRSQDTRDPKTAPLAWPQRLLAMAWPRRAIVLPWPVAWNGNIVWK